MTQIDEAALEAAAKLKHERFRKTRTFEQVEWDRLLPVYREAAIEEARLTVSAYLEAVRGGL